MSSQDVAVELSGQLKTVAVSLTKIANDLRWMNSGPLPASVRSRCRHCSGQQHHARQGQSGDTGGSRNDRRASHRQRRDDYPRRQSGNFQLNVMLPVIAYNLIQSIELLTNAARSLADDAIAGFKVNSERIAAATARNPILVTALNPIIVMSVPRKCQACLCGRQNDYHCGGEYDRIEQKQLEKLLNPRVDQGRN